MDYEKEALIRHVNEAKDGFCHCQKMLLSDDQTILRRHTKNSGQVGNA